MDPSEDSSVAKTDCSDAPGGSHEKELPADTVGKSRSHYLWNKNQLLYKIRNI